MATINFPASPSLNDTYSFGGKTWVWNGSAWDLQSTGAINATPIGNISPSTGAFTTLTATAGNITINQAQGEVVYAKSGVLATGNVDSYSYTVANGAAVLSPNNYQVSAGVTTTLGIGATQQFSSQFPSIIGGAGIAVTGGTDNKLTIASTVANVGIANSTVNSTQYLVFGNSSGNLTTASISTTQLTFNPGTGRLTVGNLVLNNPLPTTSGGTGNANLSAGSLLVGNGPNPVQQIAPGQAGNTLVSNGVTWYSGPPMPYGMDLALSRNVILP